MGIISKLRQIWCCVYDSNMELYALMYYTLAQCHYVNENSN